MRKPESKTFAAVTPATARKELSKYDGNMEHMLRTQLQLLEHMQSTISVEMMTGLQGKNASLLQEDIDKAKAVSAMMEHVSATLVRWRAAQKKLGDAMTPEQVLDAAEKLIMGLPRVDRRKAINRLIAHHNASQRGPWALGTTLLPDEDTVEVAEVHAVTATQSLHDALSEKDPE